MSSAWRSRPTAECSCTLTRQRRMRHTAAAAASAALWLTCSLALVAPSRENGGESSPTCLGRGDEECMAADVFPANGGWDPTASPELDSTFCNIPRKPLAGGSEWIHKSGLNRPVIFIRPGGHDDNAAARRATTRAALLSQHGGDNVILSSANTYSYEKRTTKLQDYLGGSEYMSPRTPETLANETWYMFGDNEHDKWGDVFGTYLEPPYFHEHERLTGYETALSFGIGGSGTGVPFHVHGGGFSEVLWGRKRWFLTPKGVMPRFDPNRTTLHWLHHAYEDTVPANLSFQGGLYDCVIGPGEVLWFPANWYHATLNIGQTVFMSTFV